MAVKYEKYLIGSKIIRPHMSVNNSTFVFDVSFRRAVLYPFDRGLGFIVNAPADGPDALY